LPQEERRAEAATVAWMLTTLTTAAGLVCCGGATLLVWRFETPPTSLAMLPGLLMLMSTVAGLVVLILTPVVLRLRNAQPPKSITVGAVLIGAAPIVLLAVMAVTSSLK
jgi:hypothetical protein